MPLPAAPLVFSSQVLDHGAHAFIRGAAGEKQFGRFTPEQSKYHRLY
jgi:hypothetical protein